MENIQIQQLNNTVEVIGILKSKELEVKEQLSTGKNLILLYLKASKQLKMSTN
ncbi:hypothetical protein [Neobacillus cucumis]|uniref:hypothetical protein n=1 Tax=Neobacillus cucumis TaxID=1740721 RepID=UPI002E1AF97B|nr:hypothetical protein [Neobacillus cucumis]